MKIQVVKISNKNVWYSDCIGQIFHVFDFANTNEVWFSQSLFFFPNDVKIINSKRDGYVPSISVIGFA